MRRRRIALAMAAGLALAAPAGTRAAQVHDLAILSLRATRTVRLTDTHDLRAAHTTLRLQNRGSADLEIPDLATLEAGIRVEAERIDGPITCADLSIIPRPPRKGFPIQLAPGKKLRLHFDMVLACGSNPEADLADWRFTARIDHALLDGQADARPEDDVCPRDPLGRLAGPLGTFRDRGCGRHRKGGAREAPVLNVKDRRSSTRLLRAGPWGVGSSGLVLVDGSRPTGPNGDFPGLPDRTLPTRVWYPAAPGGGGEEAELDRSGAPYPLVLFNHGLGSPNDASLFLVEHLASHGYVVAAPAFPLSTLGAPGGPTMADAPAEAGDVSFVIDTFLGFSAASGNRFEGAIDGGRIALTGHSAGGLTTVVATYDSCVRDPRIRAAAPMAGAACFFEAGYFDDVRVPLLILHGDADLLVDFTSHAETLFSNANAPKALLRVLGGNHLGFSDAGTVVDDLLGCSFLPDPVTMAAQTTALVEGLGGAAHHVGTEACATEYCVGSGEAIDGLRQQQIARQSILAFFEWILRGDTRARRYLREELEAENPDLVFDSSEGF